MRTLTSFLLIAFALTATSAEIWRWKDANGVMHFSDQPVPGAVRVETGPVPAPSRAAPAVAPPREPVQTGTPVPYTSCIVVGPAHDETFNAVNTVNVTLQVTPALQTDHRLRVIVDGQPYAEWPERALSYTLVNVYRGSHTLSAQVLDAEGKSVCAGVAITFHVRQPSIFSPARQGQTARP